MLLRPVQGRATRQSQRRPDGLIYLAPHSQTGCFGAWRNVGSPYRQLGGGAIIATPRYAMPVDLAVCF